MVRILGIDPGLAHCGVAVMEADASTARILTASCFTTESQVRKQKLHASHDAMKRASDLADYLWSKVHGVDLVAYEGVSMPRHASSAGKLCMAFGVVAALCRSHSLPSVQFSPTEVARFFGPRLKGEDMKAPRIAWVEERYPGLLANIRKDEKEHPADAVGLCHLATKADIFYAIAGRRPA